MPSVTSCAYDRDVCEASVDELNMGTYTLGFIVLTDGVMGPQAVANAALLGSPHPLPSLWSTYSYQGDTDSLSYARRYHVTRDGSVLKYKITVTYLPPEPAGAPMGGGTPVNAEPNPLERDPIFWWDREVFTRVVHRDKDGELIQNKAEGLYPHDVELEKTRGVLVIEFNVATLAQVIQISRKYDQAINSAPWNIGGGTVPTRAALCREVSSSPPQTEHGYSYFHMSLRFAFQDEGGTWEYGIPEWGQFHWEKDSEGEYITTRTGHRTRVNAGEPVKLNEDGTRKEDGGEAIVTAWRIRREEDFNTLITG
jgi:hypothetical protein